MRRRLADQQPGAGARRIDAQNGDERGFSRRRVLLRRLSQRRRIPFRIEKVVGDLESEPQIVSEKVQRVPSLLGRARQDCAGLTRKADERAGLHPLHARNRRDVGHGMFGDEVDHLPPHHAPATGRDREPPDQFAAHRSVFVGGFVGQHLESQRQQRVTGKHRRCLVEGDMTGRLPAPHVVVVHRRKIVVDEGIAMHEFDRRADSQCILIRRAAEARAAQHQEWPQPFAPAQRRIPHRLEQARFRTGRLGQQ